MKSTKNRKAAQKPKSAQPKAKPAVKKTAAAVKATKPKVAASASSMKAVRAPKKIMGNPVKEVTLKTAKKQEKLSPREEKIQHIKLKLLRQRESLLNEAESALNELPGQTIFPDLGDQATAETDRNFMLRLRGREQRLLKKIDEAIDRIDSGIFGICDDCGNEIDIKRLEARPVTTMCIECKTLQEEEERIREGS
ncbi:MAG: RNA polymerase-binding protein DksA [Nitrospiraceae bacterium]|nr:RNA polymerase-binding protein DksA [Nitrospiraceae bacterium]